MSTAAIPHPAPAPLIDTHAHLDDRRLLSEIDSVLARAQVANVDRIITIGIDLDSSRAARELAHRFPQVFATAGIHPHNASSLDPAALAALRTLARDPLVVAIGEIGLDYYRMLSPRHVQQAAFETQLALAQELRLPVVIHIRDAAGSQEASDDVLATLARWHTTAPAASGVLHCFSGDLPMLEHVLDLGFSIGLDGPVTYPKASQTHAVARAVPLDRLLLETDSPYLAPQPWRGKRNEPAYLTTVAETLATLRGTTSAEIAHATTTNANRLFSLVRD